MGRFPVDKIRNIVFLSGSDTGKTSIGEAILFITGATDKLGKTRDKSSFLDFEEEEIEKGISIGTAIASVEWKGWRCNFIDTPGVSAFIFDTLNSMRVAEAGVFVFSACDSIKVETERLWKSGEEHALPSLIFINKLDREHADFMNTLSAIEKSLGIKVLPVCFPIGRGAEFKGIVDLVNDKAVYYNENTKKETEANIPAEIAPALEEYRKKIAESAAEQDDATLEKYLNGQSVSKDEVLKNLRKGILARRIFPVFCGSAGRLAGITTLLNLLPEFTKSPLEKGDISGKDPSNGNNISRKLSSDEPFSAWVFKTIIDPFAGKISYVRVFSGILNSDTQVLNSSRNIKERIGPVYLLKGKKQEHKDSCEAGDIVAFVKLKETATGDTLCNEKSPVLYKGIDIPRPIISFAIKPKTKADDDRLTTAISKLLEEDPILHVQRDQQTKEIILAGISQAQIEIAVAKLKRKFNTDVEIAAPKVPYKETVKGKSRVQGRYKKQSGGRGQYGDCWLEVDPLPRGKGYEFVDKIVGGVIPRQFIPSVEKGVKEAITEGVLAFYPVEDIRVSLVDGSYHVVDSSDIAFKIAGAMALRKALQQANPVLLEPIMSMEIVVPDDYVGDVIGDLNSRRGKILGVEASNSYQMIKAYAPMSEVLMYAADLRSLSQGKGSFTMEFHSYNEVPAHISSKIIETRKKERVEGEIKEE